MMCRNNQSCCPHPTPAWLILSSTPQPNLHEPIPLSHFDHNEELDEDRDGEIPRKLVATFLAMVGRNPKTCATQITAFCRGGTPRNKSCDQRGQREERRKQDVAGGEEEEEGEEKEWKSATTREGKKNRVAFASDGLSWAPPPSTASLAEILATFGFVFESAGTAVKPSVAEAFAMLRLHAQPAEARAAGEAAKRYLREEQINPNKRLQSTYTNVCNTWCRECSSSMCPANDFKRLSTSA